MISLLQLLKEIQSQPKALILAGAPGSGKSTILKGVDLKSFKKYNLDDEFINLLKSNSISLDLKNHDKELRSKSAILQAQATNKLKTETLPKAIENKESFILDGTAASLTQTTLLKNELENAGYKVYMLYVYADLEVSLKQNQDRFEKSGGQDRSLQPLIVMRTWDKVTSNFDNYKNMFGSNFVSVSNTGEQSSMKDIKQIVKTYIEPYTPKDTTIKDPNSQEKSNKSKENLNVNIQKFLSSNKVQDIITSSVSKEEAQKTLKQFLS